MAIDISPSKVDENYELTIFEFLYAKLKNYVAYLFNFEEIYSQAQRLYLEKTGRARVWCCISDFVRWATGSVSSLILRKSPQIT